MDIIATTGVHLSAFCNECTHVRLIGLLVMGEPGVAVYAEDTILNLYACDVRVKNTDTLNHLADKTVVSLTCGFILRFVQMKPFTVIIAFKLTEKLK